MGGVTEAFCAAVELSDTERNGLLQLCRQRLDAFREQRGEEVCCLLRQKPAASRRSLRLREQEPPPHADQRLDQSPGAHPCQGQLRMLRGGLLLGKPCRTGSWRWTTSSPKTRAVRTTSATCRPSASAAMPACDGRREAGCVFCALEASGRVLVENELALCIADADPVTPGRSLVIPRRHGADGLALHQPQWSAVVELPHPIVHKLTSTC